MKRTLAFILVILCVAFLFAGCVDNKDTINDNTTATTTEVDVTTDEVTTDSSTTAPSTTISPSDTDWTKAY